MVRNDVQNSVGGVVSFQIVWGFYNSSAFLITLPDVGIPTYGKVLGFVDFEDACVGPLLFDLAVCVGTSSSTIRIIS